jgi:hypothetical protein
MLFDAVFLMIDSWIVEQNHQTLSPYRYLNSPMEETRAFQLYGHVLVGLSTAR